MYLAAIDNLESCDTCQSLLALCQFRLKFLLLNLLKGHSLMPKTTISFWSNLSSGRNLEWFFCNRHKALCYVGFLTGPLTALGWSIVSFELYLYCLRFNLQLYSLFPFLEHSLSHMKPISWILSTPPPQKKEKKLNIWNIVGRLRPCSCFQILFSQILCSTVIAYFDQMRLICSRQRAREVEKAICWILTWLIEMNAGAWHLLVCSWTAAAARSSSRSGHTWPLMQVRAPHTKNVTNLEVTCSTATHQQVALEQNDLAPP